MERSFTERHVSPRHRPLDSDRGIDSEDDVAGSSRELGKCNVTDESNDNDADMSNNMTSEKDKFSDDDTPILRLARHINSGRYNVMDNSDEGTDDDEDNSAKYRAVTDLNKTSGLGSSGSLNETEDTRRKYVSRDNTREGIQELRPNSSSEILNTDFVNIDHSYGQSNTNYKPASAKDFEQNSESEFATSFAIEDIENVNPAVARNRATEISKLDQCKSDSITIKRPFTGENIQYLFEKRQRLENCMRQEAGICTLTREMENTPLLSLSSSSGSCSISNVSQEVVVHTSHFAQKSQSFNVSSDYSDLEDLEFSDFQDYSDPNYSDDDSTDDSYSYFDDMLTRPRRSWFKKLESARAANNKDRVLTIEGLLNLHGSLVACPSENVKVEDPMGLNVELMPHQRHALAWLLWRENQKPCGGVLADDMGLGKTLTMISLIVTDLYKNIPDDSNDKEESNDKDKWINKNKPSYPKGGTLVVCPASLLAQWKNEVWNRCERGLLSVEMYHGNNRQSVSTKLTKNNIVITTYHILTREYKFSSTLYKIHWERVILDEAHIIRNPKSQGFEAVCKLSANKRWCLTGTPIQNKELDLYSILKFLRCSPFDDIRVWKRWVDKKDKAGHQRLATVMKTLMLRRTKEELMAKGEIENLPDKSIQEVKVYLDDEEQLVYQKILKYSRTLFAQFLAQREEKQRSGSYTSYGGAYSGTYSGTYSKPTHFFNSAKASPLTKAQSKLLQMHTNVKTYEILVLLLRLRQVCCHPALIRAMLDQEDVKQSGIMDMEMEDADFFAHVKNMQRNSNDYAKEKDLGFDPRTVANLLLSQEEGIDKKILGDILTSDNSVFDDDRSSSKMKVLLHIVQKILQKDDDKLIIVSQWAKLLDVIASRLSLIKGATYSKFTGGVAIKDRQDVVDSFNSQHSGPRILLLSLTAGGVGLNLVGGNHLLLFDIHWNPQLETQAQDRIYRFGQTKNVYIYKFICVDTIEERVRELQERKLEIARNVLSGDRSNAATKLTLNDLKSLFGF
ncbi:PREDICTED: transcription termination factor 2-like isoform X2 [Vollenhovia emeryi]|uniref:transcription termination factor 2-like isoform X2 n=1 Tax=Vollenhovia emeryi TaxID=411798 RepID=UPI0005F424AF|nr:PREDICTED: transcription termination factor 2-like isoform X2 [Vollenhovia emeryi]